MKFKVTMKDPDGVFESVCEAARNMQSEAEMLLPEDEQDALYEMRREKLATEAKRWFKYDEYLTVEIDTEVHTCVVVKA